MAPLGTERLQLFSLRASLLQHPPVSDCLQSRGAPALWLFSCSSSELTPACPFLFILRASGLKAILHVRSQNCALRGKEVKMSIKMYEWMARYRMKFRREVKWSLMDGHCSLSVNWQFYFYYSVMFSNISGSMQWAHKLPLPDAVFCAPLYSAAWVTDISLTQLFWPPL